MTTIFNRIRFVAMITSVTFVDIIIKVMPHVVMDPIMHFTTIRMSFATTNTWDIFGFTIYLILIVELWYYKFKNKHFQNLCHEYT